METSSNPANGDKYGDIEFIPRIQNGFGVDCFRNALKQHREWCQNVISIPIEGVKDLTRYHIVNGTKMYTFQEGIYSEITNANDKKLIHGIEPTKDSDTTGRYLLLLAKEDVQDAERSIDLFFDWLKSTGKGNAIAFPGMEIKRRNKTFNTDEMPFADILAQKYGNKKTIERVNNSKRRGNAWNNRKRTPQMIFDTSDDTKFPHIEAQGKRLKQAAAFAQQSTTLRFEP